MDKFLHSNEWQWRLARTVVQAVLGFVIANIDLITGSFSLDPTAKTLIVGLVMAVLSPIMAQLGSDDGEDKALE